VKSVLREQLDLEERMFGQDVGTWAAANPSCMQQKSKSNC